MPDLDRLLRDARSHVLTHAARAFDVALGEVYQRLAGEEPRGTPAELVLRLVQRDLLTPEAALHLGAAWTILSDLRDRAAPRTTGSLVDMRRHVRNLVDTVFARN